MALSQHDSVDQGGNACSTKGDHRKSLLAPGEATRPLLSQTRCAGNPFGGGGGGDQRMLEQTQEQHAGNEEATSRKKGRDVFGLGLFPGLR